MLGTITPAIEPSPPGRYFSDSYNHRNCDPGRGKYFPVIAVADGPSGAGCFKHHTASAANTIAPVIACRLPNTFTARARHATTATINAGIKSTCSAKKRESVSVEMSLPPNSHSRAIRPASGNPLINPSATRVLKNARASHGNEQSEQKDRRDPLHSARNVSPSRKQLNDVQKEKNRQPLRSVVMHRANPRSRRHDFLDVRNSLVSVID